LQIQGRSLRGKPIWHIGRYFRVTDEANKVVFLFLFLINVCSTLLSVQQPRKPDFELRVLGVPCWYMAEPGTSSFHAWLPYALPVTPSDSDKCGPRAVVISAAAHQAFIGVINIHGIDSHLFSGISGPPAFP
jgi:hypothetical protein